MSTTTTTSSKVTLSALGRHFIAFAHGDTAATLTDASFKAAGVTESLQAVRAGSDAVYTAASVLARVRESGAAGDVLENRAKVLRSALYAWFKMCGTRPAEKEGGKLRPAYTPTDADLVIIGESCQQARADSDGTLASACEHFFKAFVLSTARLLEGKPLTRCLSEKDVANARKAARAAIAEKAAKTRKANADKKAAEVAKSDHATVADVAATAIRLNAENLSAIIGDAVKDILAMGVSEDVKARLNQLSIDAAAALTAVNAIQ